MARKKRLTESNDSDIDSLFDGMCNEAKKHYGTDNIFTGSEAERQIVGMYLPALCLRYLFQSNVIPMSRMGQIVGEEGSCKSSLLYEIMRLTRANKGRSYLMEAETKDSPILRMSILNYDDKAVVIRPCESMEEWQEGLTYCIDLVQGLMIGTKTNPGPGKIAPVCFGVDSLMGKACRDTIAKIQKEGFAQRAFPAEALLISQYMKYIPQQIAKWPFILWGINHLKPGTDQQGRPKNSIAGGKSLKFQETYEIEMKRIKDIKKVGVNGITLKLLMRKNSLGQSRLSIDADMLWWLDEENDYVQRTVWDWNAATIELLLSFEGSRANKICDVCGIKLVDKSKKLVCSEVLGVPRSDPVSFSKAGELIENNPEVIKGLHQLLSVHEHLVFRPGVDYGIQLEEAKELSETGEVKHRGIVSTRSPELISEAGDTEDE